ncbi:mitotic checkpoint regulator, MAD2B-interacting-domain-containing protein [Cercophora scortea]|uniref:Mitotic checkpoint regulator, MAD2B-interacting-domain-containing protein n=1 Tax=Cercophora scortea TaxID=314031 RepID=A0AAE0IXW4_9PEZI|nr:mitotic checkpoint regulator, MAD2B-interacting-domain-containing protein [Cercophora scortea]
MGLVDYSDSDSDSDSEAVQTKPTSNPVAATSASTTAKKPAFQKLVDRAGAGSGKIIVNLPTAASADPVSQSEDAPPAKRAKTAAGSSRFSSFGSFLPPPKKTTITTSSSATAPPTTTTATSSSSSSSNKPAARPLVNLKTGSEPAFNRAGDGDGDDTPDSYGSGLGLPPPRKAAAGPSIPVGQKDESEVKLVGKPLMFKPLSVARRPGQTNKNKKKPTPYGGPGAAKTTATTTTTAAQTTIAEQPDNAPPKKKISLFSMDADDNNSTSNPKTTPAETPEIYEPLFTGAIPLTETETGFTDSSTTHTYDIPPPQTQAQAQAPQSLSSIADSLSLSASARRELFGRAHGGGNGAIAGAVPAGAKVISFNMEQEYAHNNAVLRTASAAEKEVYNPVRSIAPGKHSLRQMVNMAQNNQEALEESFIQGKNTRKDAAGRYGWK